MADNVAVLETALQILSDHGINVEKVAGWKTRAASSIPLVPEACAVHHTSDVSTPLSIIRDGRTGLPGPLANFLVGQSGRIYLVSAGYTNNVGYGGYANWKLATQGELDEEVSPPATDGSWSGNRHVWGIEADGTGKWEPQVREHVIAVCAALHIAQDWTNGARVIAHKELTRRKPGDPGDDMGEVRADVLAKIAEWTTPVTPDPIPEPDPIPDPVPEPTPEPDPIPTPEPGPTKIQKFRFGTFNAQYKAWGGDGNLKADGVFLKRDMRCSIYALQEVDEANRNAIRAVLGSQFLTYPNGLVALVWNDDKYEHGLKKQMSLGTVAARCVRTMLTDRETGMKMVVASIHVRPGAVTTLAGKLNDARKIAEWLSGVTHPVIVAGDWNTAKVIPIMEKAGFRLASPKADTLDKPGTQTFDMIFVRDGDKYSIDVRDGGVENPGTHSDHKGVWASLTLHN